MMTPEVTYRPADQTPRYAPTQVFIVRGAVHGRMNVRRYFAHPPGRHPVGCPLSTGCVALECQTDMGSVWYGVTRAYINSELRMVIEGVDPKDEVRRAWPVVPEDCRS